MMRSGGTDHSDREALGAAHARGANRVLAAPIPRAASWLLLAFIMVVVFALGWASLARTDRVATAEGQTVPDRRVQRIQTHETGVVDRLLVREGDHVDAGAELVHIDRAEIEAEFSGVRTQLMETRARILRLEAMTAQLEDAAGNGLPGAEAAVMPALGEVPADWSPAPSSEMLARHQHLLTAEWQAYRQELASAREQLARRQSEHAATEVELAGLRQVLPYVESQRDRMERMAERELAPVSELDDAIRMSLEQQAEHDALEMAMESDRVAIDHARSELIGVHRRTLRDAVRELAEAEERQAQLRDDLRRMRAQLDRRTITTPVGGTVMDLQIHGAGEVVEPGHAMMKIVPQDSPLEVRAYVSNRDIGRVRAGMPVDIKFEAFDFTRHGAVEGELVHVSRDATEHEDLGHVYPVLVEIDRDYMYLEGQQVALVPGMDVTVDIGLGDRRVIEYFLAPMLRYQHESLREP